MNSKAIRKQLLAAVAMVLVAAVALGSSTYAWFVASGTVTATGMKVQAQSEGGLAISFDGQAWGTSATANMTTAQKLLPTSTNNLTTWVHASAKAADASAAEMGSYSDVSTSIFSETGDTLKDKYIKSNSYVVWRQFLIRSTSLDSAALSKGLFVKDIKVTLDDATKNPEKTMSTALRVAVECGSHKYIYGPVKVTNSGSVTSATDNYTVYELNDQNKAVAKQDKVKLAALGSTSLLVPESQTITNAYSGVPVNIYIWFEGEDAKLFSDNYYVEGLNVSVEFQSYSSANAVDLTASGVTVSSSVSDNVTIGEVTYHLITGATALSGVKLYTTSTSLSTSSQIFTISGDSATPYTNVTLPTT